MGCEFLSRSSDKTTSVAWKNFGQLYAMHPTQTDRNVPDIYVVTGSGLPFLSTVNHVGGGVRAGLKHHRLYRHHAISLGKDVGASQGWHQNHDGGRRAGGGGPPGARGGGRAAAGGGDGGG